MFHVDRIEYEGDAETSVKDILAAVAAGLKEGVLFWQKKIAPGHFLFTANAKYGYRPRLAGYKDRKRRLFKAGLIPNERQPLVLTGETRKWVTTRFGTPRARKTAQGHQARLPIKAPKHFYQYRGNAPDKPAELLRMIPAEMEQLNGIVGTNVVKALAAPKKKRVRKL